MANKTKATRKAAADSPATEPAQVSAKPEISESQKNFEAEVAAFGDKAGESMRDDPTKAVNSLLTQFEKMTRDNMKLMAEIESLRLTAGVQAKEHGGSRIVDGKEPDLVLDKPKPETALSGEYAVFRSPFPGFKQVIRRGNTVRHPNGDYHLEPPLLAEFTRGVCVLYDPSEIEAMRAKLTEKTRKGEADFIEVTDPSIKKDAMKGQRVFVSDTVTTETPLESVI